MQRFNHPIVTAIALAAFLWLAWYSWQHDKYAEHGYTHAQIAAFNRLVVASSGKPSLKQRQAAALKDIYQLTDNDIAKPVNLFGQTERE